LTSSLTFGAIVLVGLLLAVTAVYEYVLVPQAEEHARSPIRRPAPDVQITLDQLRVSDGGIHFGVRLGDRSGALSVHATAVFDLNGSLATRKPAGR
jgi:hypothetical protein